MELVRKHVKPIQAPWLVPHLSHLAESTAIPTAQLIPTQIKHLRSTAPVDPRARIAADQEAKAAKRAGIYVAVD